MTMNVYLAIDEFSDAQLDHLRQELGDTKLIPSQAVGHEQAIDPGFQHCEVAFGNVPAHWLQQSDKLQWVQLESVGFGEYRSLDWQQLQQQITMTNLAGFFAEPVAQTALAGILTLYRGIDQLVQYQQQKFWNGDPLRTQLRSLTGAAVVLFGYGAINRKLEELLSPFDCKLTSFGSRWTDDELDIALAKADIVVSTTPETDATTGVFDQRRLALLRSDAVFVNCGRGSVVDETALSASLHAGLLGGAVIDVTNDEPLPPEHPFWSTPRLLLTQHTGGGTIDELDRKIGVFIENFHRFSQQQPLHSVVDFARGY